MNNTKLLIIDYNSICYKGCFTAGHLTYNDKFTGGIYSFLSQMCKYVNFYKPDHLLLCKDYPPYKRSMLYPAYKQDRIKDPVLETKIKETRKYINEFLQMMGIHIYEYKGMEADDYIASICIEYPFFSKIIVSNDSDLFQLLNYNITLIRNNVEYTKNNFIETYGIDPHYWINIICLAGGHNGVPGIPGIGIKTALKILKDEKKKKDIYTKYKEELELYEKLAILPFSDFCVPFDMFMQYKIKYNEREIIKHLAMYGIELTNAMDMAFTFLGGNNER